MKLQKRAMAAGGLLTVALLSAAAVAYWRISAEADLKQCVAYYSGKGVPQDYVKAAEWCRKAANLGGNARAQSNLGAMYLNGKGVPQNYSIAIGLFRKAAAQGDAVAESNLGTMYENGFGVAQDYTTAVGWFRKSADQGAAIGQLHLGLAYEAGWGVPKDRSTAAGWYRKAAEQGLAGAQNLLGDMYRDGDGVPQDKAEAVHWYRQAAAQGDAGGQFELGASYELGWGVPKDPSTAAGWYLKAADQGLAEAQSLLGRMYLNGDGVPQDEAEAVKWFRLAAVQGDPDAQKKLGEILVPEPTNVMVSWDQAKDGSKVYTVGGLTLVLSAGKDGSGAAVPQLRVTPADGRSFVLQGQHSVPPAAATFGVGHIDPGLAGDQVLFTSNTGGAHCCDEVVVLELGPQGWRTVKVGDFEDGDSVADFPKDVDGDGVPDFVVGDDRFDYAFASHAESYEPPQILDVVDGSVVDVSAQPKYAKLFRKDLAITRAACLKHSNGGCAAFVADASRLGLHDWAWPIMLANYDATSDSIWPTHCLVPVAADGTCPNGQEQSFSKMPDALQAFLVDNGYMTASQAAPPPLTTENTAGETDAPSTTTVPAQDINRECSECIKKNINTGSYTSLDGGRSAYALMQICEPITEKWIEDCVSKGGSAESCGAGAGIGAQLAMKSMNR